MIAGNLTELELEALLPTVVNLSDGHARQSLGAATRDRVQKVFETSLAGEPADYFQAERRFLDDMSWHTGQEYPRGRTFVTYASSVAMGVVSTYLKQIDVPVGVVCPTFDNIPGIMRTMDVHLVPVRERHLVPEIDVDHLNTSRIGALILVVPNNPTGRCPTREALCRIMDWAAQKGVVLVLDLAFRWFDDATNWDVIHEADERGADVISIDDTGKVLSLSDLKAAVISTSRRLVKPLRAIHTQYVLNVSELGLRLLSAMMEPAYPDNEIVNARHIVDVNRSYLDDGIAANLDAIGQDPRIPDRNDRSSIEWLSLAGDRDQTALRCRARGVEVLVGDHFHWSGSTGETGRHLRLALMRDPRYFVRGADVFLEVLTHPTPMGSSHRNGVPR